MYDHHKVSASNATPGPMFAGEVMKCMKVYEVYDITTALSTMSLGAAVICMIIHKL